ncbi:hypothetical protein BX265_4980 [Streptomyces sp. TLI_235]|nr:hypothetical protein [Streptomyces sp. TLI_235]PBC80144.1 hypothetical protein BX265_4980 [Streptomyces sp. TLI_235]
MSREYKPRPGVTWERRTVRREVVIPDGPWDGLPVVVTPWPAEPDPPRPNRATRRALARNARKANHQ